MPSKSNMEKLIIIKNYKQILEAINRGIQFALDDFESEDMELSKPKLETITKEDSLYLNLLLREYVVDLGLPSGTLWCKYNLGCDFEKLNNSIIENSNPKDWYGDYYAWGEIKTKNEYSWKTYKYKDSYDKQINTVKLNRYYTTPQYLYNDKPDNLIELQNVDDVAYLNMHIGKFKFHIPTKEQFEELLEYTMPSWKNVEKDFRVYRYLILISKINGNKIIFPPVGCYDNMQNNLEGLTGYYWTSTLYTSYNSVSYAMVFNNHDEIVVNDRYRYNGMAIRPVINL